MPLPKLAWDFNGTTTDYVSGVVPTTTTGSIAYVSGKYIQAINLPNPTTNGSTPPSYQLTYSISVQNTVSLCFWINFTVNNLFGQSPVCIPGLNNSYLDASGKFHIYSGNDVTMNFVMSPGVWYHIALVFSNSICLGYINGQYINQGTAPATFTSTTLYVGSQGNKFAANCSIDDLRIFDRALTSAQVQSIYNQQGVPGMGFVAYISPSGPASIIGNVISSNVYTAGRQPDISVASQTTYSNGASYTFTNFGTNIPLTPTTTGLSVSAYFKYTTVPYPGEGLWTCRLTSNTNVVIYARQTGGTDSIFGALNSNISAQINSNTINIPQVSGYNGNRAAWVAGRKDHIVYTFTNTAPVVGRMYVNGLLNGTATSSNVFIAPDGNYTCHVPGNAFGPADANMSMYDFRIVNGILSASQVAMLYRTLSGNNVPVPAPPLKLTGTPLFSQLSSGATSSAVGAFSLRAVNGSSAKAVQVRPDAKFPPGVFTATSTVISALSYSQYLTGYPFGGTGVYTSNSSSGTGASTRSWRAFDGITGSNGSRWISDTTYVANTPYTGTASTTAGGVTYPGEWLQIQLPQAIVLSSYSIFPQSTNIPATWNVFASNDGTTWNVIDQRGTQTLVQNQYNNYTISGSPAAYSYYRIGCYIISLNISFAIVEMKLYGAPPNTATDFYADRLGNLLTAPVTGQSLANWLGGATGYVRTWYDQSGAGNHASQATAANQPVIQRATKGPGYSCLFNGTTNKLTFGTVSTLTGVPFTVNFVMRKTVDVSGIFAYGNNGDNNNRSFGIQTSGGVYAFGRRGGSGIVSYTIPLYNAATEPIYYLTNMLSSNFRNSIYSSGTYTGTTGTSWGGFMTNANVPFTIGQHTALNAQTYFTGEMYEILVFTKSLYDVDNTGGLITQIYQNQLGAYGT